MGQVFSLETVRAARGLPRATSRPRVEHDEIDAILHHYSHHAVFPNKRGNLRALCVRFCERVVKVIPATPPWTRFFFFRMPLDPKLYSRMSYGTNVEDESWWVLDKGTDTALALPENQAKSVSDEAKPIFSLPMSEFFRL